MVTHDVDEALFLSDRIVHDDQRPRRAHRRRHEVPFRGRAIATRCWNTRTTTRSANA